MKEQKKGNRELEEEITRLIAEGIQDHKEIVRTALINTYILTEEKFKEECRIAAEEEDNRLEEIANIKQKGWDNLDSCEYEGYGQPVYRGVSLVSDEEYDSSSTRSDSSSSSVRDGVEENLYNSFLQGEMEIGHPLYNQFCEQEESEKIQRFRLWQENELMNQEHHLEQIIDELQIDTSKLLFYVEQTQKEKLSAILSDDVQIITDKTAALSVEEKKTETSRNSTSYAWYDRDITLANKAFNRKDHCSYFESGVGDDRRITGVLKGNGDNPLRVNGNLIIELPPMNAADSGTTFVDSLDEQLGFIETLSEEREGLDYPIKIIAPYKLDAWHWNVLEVVIHDKEQTNIQCCRYDTDGKIKPVEASLFAVISERLPGIQNQAEASKDYYPFAGQRGVNCGLVASIIAHDLKQGDKAFYNSLVTEGISDQELRDRTHDMVSSNLINPVDQNAFCRIIDERVFVVSIGNIHRLNEEQKAIIAVLDQITISKQLQNDLIRFFREKDHTNLQDLRDLLQEEAELKNAIFKADGEEIKDFDAAKLFFLEKSNAQERKTLRDKFLESVILEDEILENSVQTFLDIAIESRNYDELEALQTALLSNLDDSKHDQFIEITRTVIENIQTSKSSAPKTPVQARRIPIFDEQKSSYPSHWSDDSGDESYGKIKPPKRGRFFLFGGHKNDRFYTPPSNHRFSDDNKVKRELRTKKKRGEGDHIIPSIWVREFITILTNKNIKTLSSELKKYMIYLFPEIEVEAKIKEAITALEEKIKQNRKIRKDITATMGSSRNRVEDNPETTQIIQNIKERFIEADKYDIHRAIEEIAGRFVYYLDKQNTFPKKRTSGLGKNPNSGSEGECLARLIEIDLLLEKLKSGPVEESFLTQSTKSPSSKCNSKGAVLSTIFDNTRYKKERSKLCNRLNNLDRHKETFLNYIAEQIANSFDYRRTGDQALDNREALFKGIGRMVVLTFILFPNIQSELSTGEKENIYNKILENILDQGWKQEEDLNLETLKTGVGQYADINFQTAVIKIKGHKETTKGSDATRFMTPIRKKQNETPTKKLDDILATAGTSPPTPSIPELSEELNKKALANKSHPASWTNKLKQELSLDSTINHPASYTSR